jgi:glycine/D-amino acid oxidase-like deaminating enzyme
MKSTTSRRSVLQSAALPAINLLAAPPAQPKVVVVGAGAFGGWTALHLLRMGARVTLVDAWGPGNSRASSGGETRILRAAYGTDKIYFEMVKRSLEILRDSERRWNRRLYHNIGCLLFAGVDDTKLRSSLTLFQDVGLPAEELSPAQAAKRWPPINFEGIPWMLYEKDAGYLPARRNCAWVLDGLLHEGGVYRQLEAKPGRTNGQTLAAVNLSDNSELAADYFVFALGPWLGKVFPDEIGERIRPSRQQVFFFGTKPGDPAFDESRIPCWINHTTPPFYGIPGNEWRGFKIANDSRGPDFDPTDGDRTITPEGVQEARSYLAIRFPGMEDAPLLESRVCQYENTPDHHFILDFHPSLSNVLLLGGGSGHGYKHGPAIGERAAGVLLGKRAPDAFFQLARFNRKQP